MCSARPFHSTGLRLSRRKGKAYIGKNGDESSLRSKEEGKGKRKVADREYTTEKQRRRVRYLKAGRTGSSEVV